MLITILPKIISRVEFFEKETIVSYVNAYNYLQLRKSPKKIELIDKFTLDGIFLVILIRVLYFKNFKRQSPDFSSYFNELFLQAEISMKSVFFIGATDIEIKKFVLIIKEKFPNLVVTGFKNGFFNESEVDDLTNKILDLSPDVIFIGLGTPKQEFLSIHLKNKGYKGTIYNCGAFLSQTANHGIQYYPNIINILNLRWAYRLINEKGLLKRYFIEYPFATIIIIFDFIKSKT